MKFALSSLCLLLAFRAAAEDLSLSNLLADAEQHAQKAEWLDQVHDYEEANKLAPTNADILCDLAKAYCDAMHTSTDANVVKGFAQKALATAQLSLKADPNSPKSHCCVAVCYAKNFPYLDNKTKVDYSRQIKAEAEKAIVLDPKFDLAYHMLGRWNFEVSNMGFLVKGLIKIAYGGLPDASKEMAITNFKKAIEIAPGRIIHHLQLARMYHITGQENLVPAELKQCAQLPPVDMDDLDAKNIAKKVLDGEKWPEGI